MSVSTNNQSSAGTRFFYGWVIVAVGVTLWAVAAIILNSFGVFFKPLAADFGWNRSATSTIQSFFLVTTGFISIFWGWLNERIGPIKVIFIGAVLAGSGLFMTSRVTALWQIYLTYSLLTALGMGSINPIVTTATARWFVARRGMALGMIASGAGLGTLIGPPMVARLIERFGWSGTYVVLAIGTFVIAFLGACLLRRSPESVGLLPYGAGTKKRTDVAPARPQVATQKANIAGAMHSPSLWIMVGVFTMFTFCNQMTMVHIVNYATDMGITLLMAANLVGAIGLSNILGRFLMGTASDRIGNLNTVIVSCVLASLSLCLLIFGGQLWTLGLFTLTYGFAYGAEIPQQAALVGKFFGLHAMLVAMLHAGGCVGGALGSWVGGAVFDATQSYRIAFIIAMATLGFAFVGTLVLKRIERSKFARTADTAA